LREMGERVEPLPGEARRTRSHGSCGEGCGEGRDARASAQWFPGSEREPTGGRPSGVCRRETARRGCRVRWRWAAAWALLLATGIPSGGAEPTDAVQELRFGTIRWEHTGLLTARLTIDMAWTPLVAGYRAPLDNVLECVSCADPAGVDVRKGDVLRMIDVVNSAPLPNRLLFGDEAATGLTNGTAIDEMRVLGAQPARPPACPRGT
jgi:hypothetical protein